MKPPFSGPIRLLTGTRTSSSVSMVVLCAESNCVAILRTDTPGRSRSISSSDMPP